ncbi:MAG: hypothetical protein HY587_00610 [Candidatus Omnitrophica bacterium]|nr:hypothetical protein [Candidatus Omnitrophota bacterium]
MAIFEKRKHFLPVVLITLLAVTLLLALSLPTILGTEFIQSQIRQQISKLFPAGLEIGQVGLSYFPWPHLQVRRVAVQQKISAFQDASLSFEILEVYPHLIKLLFRQIEISQLYAKDGKVRYRFKLPNTATASEIPLDDVRLTARDVRGPRRLSAKLEGGLFNPQKNVKIELAYDATRDPLWIRESSLAGEISLKNADLAKAQTALLPNSRVYLTGGFLDLGMKVSKSRREEQVFLEAQFELNGVSYKEYGSQEESRIEWIKIEMEAAFDFSTNVLNIREITIESSLGDATIRGKLDFSKDFKQEGIDLDISLPEIKLDQWKFLMPSGAGDKIQLGGVSRLNVLLRGGLEQLTAKIENNLTDAFVTIPGQFEKPAGKNLAISGQLILENRTAVKGDIEARFLDIVAKGTLLEYVSSTSVYELTFLTNKFSLAELPEVIVPLRPYHMSGSAKWLLNVRGNALRKSFAHFRTHLDTEDVSLSGPQGPLVSQLSTSVDYQENDLAIENFRCMWGGKPLLGSLKAVGPMPTSFTFQIQPSAGLIQGKGVLDTLGGEYALTSEVSGQNVPLTQVLPPLLEGKNYVEGSASFQGLVKSKGSGPEEMINNLQAAGAVKIVNGKLNTIDILGALGGVRRLVALAVESRGATQFLSADAEFETAGPTVHLKNGYLRSERFDTEFSGEVSPENLNVDLNILLSHALSKRIVPNLGVDQVLKLPARISGSPAEPEISVARSVLDATLNTLIYNFTEGLFGRSIFGERKSVPQDLVADRNSGLPADSTLPSGSEPPSAASVPSSAPDQSSEQSDQPPSLEEQLVKTGISVLSGLLGDNKS